MGLRINTNVQALNTHRSVVQNDARMSRSLERLSSGMKINRAADGPASLIISEIMRAQVAGLNQAVDNSETARSMVQTTEAALTEVNNALIDMRQLAIHAANEGANDEQMLQADQLEISNLVSTIDRITNQAQFGNKKLLDGSAGANGVGIGEGLEFVDASPVTRSSPVEGYEVRVFQLGTAAQMQGTVGLTQEMIDAGEQITISEGGKTVTFTANPGESVDETIGQLRDEMRTGGVNVTLEVDENNVLTLTHNDAGSEFNFTASSSTAGLLSQESLKMEQATPGQDIAGTIGGEYALGRGQILTGGRGTAVEGLQVRYRGDVTTAPDAGEGEPVAGRLGVFQNSLTFHVGPNAGQQVNLSVLNTGTRVLGRGVANQSDFASLRDVNVLAPQAAQDTLRLVDKAINDVSISRAKLGAFQKNTLEANLRQLRINMEELTSAESVIRDADMAKEVMEFTRNNIMMQSSTAMLAQANAAPRTVLALLNEAGR